MAEATLHTLASDCTGQVDRREEKISFPDTSNHHHVLSLTNSKHLQLRRAQLRQLTYSKKFTASASSTALPTGLTAVRCSVQCATAASYLWDDDIDIAMPLADARRFAEIAPKELRKGLVLRTPQTEPTREPIMKVRDLNSFYVEGSEGFSLPLYQKDSSSIYSRSSTTPNVSAKFCKKYGKRHVEVLLHTPPFAPLFMACHCRTLLFRCAMRHLFASVGRQPSPSAVATPTSQTSSSTMAAASCTARIPSFPSAR